MHSITSSKSMQITNVLEFKCKIVVKCFIQWVIIDEDNSGSEDILEIIKDIKRYNGIYHRDI